MCLILIGWRVHERYPLVVAANRDEFHARESEAAHWWSDHPDVFAGRDLRAGGTWMGVTRQGRFAALTNHRDPKNQRGEAPSRGHLVGDFLTGGASPAAYLAGVRERGDAYNGFNLLVGDRNELLVYSNVSRRVEVLGPGVHGLSNALLDTPWPKVLRGKAAVRSALPELPDTASLFAALADHRIAPDEELPRTGVSLEWERLLSPPFIQSRDYGTRCSTVLLAGEEIRVEERSFGPHGEATGRVVESVRLVR